MPLIIKLRLLSGKKPPEEISVKDKLKESNILTPEIDNKVNIMIVSIRYIKPILKDCFNVSLLLNDIKFVRDFFKFVSKISINKISEIRKYNPPSHCVDDLHRIKLWLRCFKFSNTVKPVEVKHRDAMRLELPDLDGAMLSQVVEGAPAFSAGIRSFDIIRQWNGVEVKNFKHLYRLAEMTRPETLVQVKLIRDGKEQVTQVVVGRRPDSIR